MFNSPSHACCGVLAGLAAAAMLLLAHAAYAASAHVPAAGNATTPTNSRHTGPLERRCDPPPYPRRAVTVAPRGQGARP